ncbi:hypothetical protein ACFLZB_04940 [Nanoarchaeota archaeon]
MKKVIAAVTMTVLSYLGGAYSVSGRKAEFQINDPVIPIHVRDRYRIGDYTMNGRGWMTVDSELGKRLRAMNFRSKYDTNVPAELERRLTEGVLREIDKNGNRFIGTNEGRGWILRDLKSYDEVNPHKNPDFTWD